MRIGEFVAVGLTLLGSTQLALAAPGDLTCKIDEINLSINSPHHEVTVHVDPAYSACNTGHSVLTWKDFELQEFQGYKLDVRVCPSSDASLPNVGINLYDPQLNQTLAGAQGFNANLSINRKRASVMIYCALTPER